LRGPLVILLLQEQIFGVELPPVERGEVRVRLSMLGG
jgi:hypothetical protein